MSPREQSNDKLEFQKLGFWVQKLTI
jgi:hypothetical protein